MKYKKNSLRFADTETLTSKHRGQLLTSSPTRRESMGFVVVPGRAAKLYRQGGSAYFSPALLLHILTYVPFIAFG